MGCHTWYQYPIVTDEKEIIQQVINKLEEWKNSPWWDEKKFGQERQIIEKAIAEADFHTLDDHMVIDNLFFINDKPIIYADYPASDEPRIAGYPETIITSEQQMLDYMKSGFTNDKGKHFDFRVEEDRLPHVLEQIKTFFQNHPDGFITFG